MTGWGMNGKFGAIFRPINLLRFGLSVHTPTFHWMRCEWATDMNASYNRPPENETSRDFWSESPILENKFRVTTPWRYNVSAAAIFGRIALLNVDAEYMNYSGINMTPARNYTDDYTETNDEMSGGFAKNALNLKTGAEIRLGPVSLRAGMAYYGSPYKNSYPIFNKEEKVSNKGMLGYSGGAGFRRNNFYIDVAYSYMQHPKHYYDMYEKIGGEMASAIFQKTANRVFVTFGFKL
jgi:hypothetical protein